MNVMINCLKLSDYNERTCGNEVKDFVSCYQQFSVRPFSIESCC